MFKPNKKPYDYISHHFCDYYQNLGYDYHGHIFERTMSPQIFANPKVWNGEMESGLLKPAERMVEFLVDSVKQIKIQFSIAHERDAKNIN